MATRKQRERKQKRRQNHIQPQKPAIEENLPAEEVKINNKGVKGMKERIKKFVEEIKERTKKFVAGLKKLKKNETVRTIAAVAVSSAIGIALGVLIGRAIAKVYIKTEAYQTGNTIQQMKLDNVNKETAELFFLKNKSKFDKHPDIKKAWIDKYLGGIEPDELT